MHRYSSDAASLHLGMQEGCPLPNSRKLIQEQEDCVRQENLTVHTPHVHRYIPALHGGQAVAGGCFALDPACGGGSTARPLGCSLYLRRRPMASTCMHQAPWTHGLVLLRAHILNMNVLHGAKTIASLAIKNDFTKPNQIVS